MNLASDIIIIGGGIIGLTLAIELRLRGASVTVLYRDFKQAAAHAAAGMLAPEAEGIPPGPMLDLCLRSRSLYPEWIRKLEDITGVSAGYWPCGILAPVYEHKGQSSSAIWLDKDAIHLHQSGLGADVIGGWWYPEDAQVDNRTLTQSLRMAAEQLGVNLPEGIAAEAFGQKNRRIVSVKTASGDWQAEQYVLAGGAWSNQLLPLPVRPKKGQMLSVRVPLAATYELPLQRILYGSEIYIVPRQDGRLIIGATSEDVGFTPHNTPAGMQKLLERAIRLYPALEQWAVEEFWWGFRPATPDELPILGSSPCENLTLATGHYRNGILLAPITASLLADHILNQKSDALLDSFHYSRFYAKETRREKQNNYGLVSNSQKLEIVESDKQSNNSKLVSPSPDSSSRLETATPVMPQLTTNNTQHLVQSLETSNSDLLIIAGRKFRSRLMTGTGKYRSLEDMRQSIAASGSEIVTVAVRRVQTKAPGHEGLAEALDWTKLWMLPNTAGCQTAEEAIRVARLGREMAKLLGQEDNNFVKLEVIPDAKYLLPDPFGTLEAAEKLVKEGFAVLPYINADPLLAKRLEEVGCVTVMPLGSPIGSGQGIKNEANIQIIIENARVPVVVDAGIGTPSEAALAMELGADATLINTAIACAKNPVAMGKAMGMAVEAGRLAYSAGRIPVKVYASASSPLTGTIVGATS
jgi:thiazole synthase